MRRDVEAVARTKHTFLAIDEDFKAAAFNIGGLAVPMRVNLTYRTLFEPNPYNHYLGPEAENLPGDATA